MTRSPRISTALAVAVVSAYCAMASAQASEPLSAQARQDDFAAFCRFVAEEYAYFDVKATDWARVCEHDAPRALAAADRDSYIHVLEQALGELYDPHAHLGTHTATSPRLVPSQADVMAAWRGGKAVVTDVRQGSAAERAGVRAGDEILAIHGRAVAEAAAELEPRFLRRGDDAARDWALRVALAGRHDQERIELRLRSSAGVREVRYAPETSRPSGLLTAAVEDRIGHVRIHNSLGDPALVREFDRALERMGGAEALVLDLRDTPSGGTSSVARGILGRLVVEERPYQRHELVGEFRGTGIRRIWVEHVAPRGTPYPGPVVALVGRWTGSMGEGLALGLHAARGAPVLGRPMAHLLGALGEITLPESGIVVRVPVEKLSHVDGTPREAFVPCSLGGQGATSGDPDPDLTAALALARKLVRSKADPSLQPGADDCAGPMR